MNIPLQLTFRDIEPSEAVEARVRQKVDKLERFYDRILGCRVVIERPHRRHHQGKLYHVRIDLSVPGAELVVNREPHERHSHEDVYVALRDSFNAIQRQLQDYMRRQQEQTKPREGPPHGRVMRLLPDYGFLQTADGREVFFHRNSVLNDGFDRLEVGTEVRFKEEEGEKGPQASTVDPVGKEGRHFV